MVAWRILFVLVAVPCVSTSAFAEPPNAKACQLGSVAGETVGQVSDVQSEANRSVYRAVLQLAHLNGTRYAEILARLPSDGTTAEKQVVTREGALDLFRQMGPAALTALSDVACDNSEPVAIRRTALRLLVDLPGAEIELTRLLEDARQNADRVVFQVGLNVGNPVTFPKELKPLPKETHPLYADLIGGEFPDNQKMLGAQIASLAPFGKKSPEVRKFFEQTLIRLNESPPGEHRDFWYFTKKDLFHAIASWENPASTRTLLKHLRTLATRDPESFMLFADEIVTEVAIDGAKLEKWRPFSALVAQALVHRAKQIRSGFEVGLAPRHEASSAWDFSKTLTFLARVDGLARNSQWHPDVMLPKMVKKIGSGELDEEQRFFLGAYSSTLQSGALPSAQLSNAWLAMRQLSDQLKNLAERGAVYSFDRERSNPGTYTDLRSILHMFRGAPAAELPTREALTPFLNEKKFGSDVAAVARELIARDR